MAFELYVKKNVRCTGPVISMTKRCVTINRKAAEELELDKAEAVKLAYDSVTDKVALYLVDKEDPLAFKIHVRPSGSRQINSLGFAEAFGLQDKVGCQMTYTREEPDVIVLSFTDKLSRYGAKSAPSVSQPPMAGPPVWRANVENNKKPADYECSQCHHSNVAWKYKKSMRPLGHPEACPKCQCQKFTVIAL